MYGAVFQKFRFMAKVKQRNFLATPVHGTIEIHTRLNLRELIIGKITKCCMRILYVLTGYFCFLYFNMVHGSYRICLSGRYVL